MSVDPMCEIVVEAALNDPFDGVIRLLGDAHRFGFELRALTVNARPGGIALAVIVLGVRHTMDDRLVAARLARHPAVLHVEVRAATGETIPSCMWKSRLPPVRQSRPACKP